MKKALIFCLLIVVLTFAQSQRQRVAVFPSYADPETNLTAKELDMLTDKIREIANTLPQEDFLLLRKDFVEKELGDEDYFDACKKGICIGNLIEKVNAQFGARCDFISMNDKLWLKFELHGTRRGEKTAETIGSFSLEVKDFYEFNKLSKIIAIIEERVPVEFRKIPNVSQPSPLDTKEKREEVSIGPSVLETESLNASSVYLSFYKSSVTSFNYKGQELKRNGITAMLGGELINKTYLIGGGGFIGGGALGDDIGEFILGVDVKKMFWILEKRFAILGTFAFSYRYQWSDIENGLIAPPIILKHRKELEDDPFGKTSIYKPYCFRFMPSIDFQYFINDNLSFYGGYMYSMTINESVWVLRYKYSIAIPNRYDPLKESKEQIFGIPGTLKFGVKYHLFN